MSMYMEFIYLGKGGDGKMTNVGCQGETDVSTKSLFEQARLIAVDVKTAPFLLDLRTDEDILDTIGMSNEGFEALSGEVVKSDLEYDKIDIEFWESAKRMMQEDAPDVLELN